MRKLLSVFFLLFNALFCSAQGEIWFKPNKGQWHENIEYKVDIPSGELFLENNGFTYSFSNIDDLYGHSHGDHSDENHIYKSHVVKTEFLNSNLVPSFVEIDKSQHYENYFIGNDQTKWVDKLYLFNEINYQEIYPGINLNIYENNATLKYDIIVAPNSDPNQFKVKYTGQDRIEIINGALKIRTSLTTITEKEPYAYQIINGLKKQVPCKFLLENDIMSFEFPDGYDSTQTLIIDPELAFSTFTGSTADNWGMTACPDINGNLIAAGVVFSSGYPTTTGAFDASFAPGGGILNNSVDIGLLH